MEGTAPTILVVDDEASVREALARLLRAHGMQAEAIVGRPLTLVSVAGVARRTVRRCAVGVYNC